MLARGYSLEEVRQENALLRAFLVLMQTGNALNKYADVLLRKAGLSTIQLVVLQVLVGFGGSATPTEIAHWTLREKHNITMLTDRMQARGLVKRVRSRKDRRSINIIITDKGRKILEEQNPLTVQIVEKVMSSITKDNAIQLEKLLRALKENVREGLEAIDKY